jgi:hypothetical protein
MIRGEEKCAAKVLAGSTIILQVIQLGEYVVVQVLSRNLRRCMGWIKYKGK